MTCTHTPATYPDGSPVKFLLPRVDTSRHDRDIAASVSLCVRCWTMYMPTEGGIKYADTERGHWGPPRLSDTDASKLVSAGRAAAGEVLTIEDKQVVATDSETHTVRVVDTRGFTLKSMR